MKTTTTNLSQNGPGKTIKKAAKKQKSNPGNRSGDESKNNRQSTANSSKNSSAGIKNNAGEHKSLSRSKSE